MKTLNKPEKIKGRKYFTVHVQLLPSNELKTRTVKAILYSRISAGNQENKYAK